MRAASLFLLASAGALLGAPPALDIPAEVRPVQGYARVLPKTDAVSVSYVSSSAVGPQAPRENGVEFRAADAELADEFLHGPVGSLLAATFQFRVTAADGLYDIDRQFCVDVAFAAAGSPVPVPVSGVCLTCVPPDVGEPIVRWVAVAVTALHILGARTDEGGQYDAMDQYHAASQIDVQVAAWVRLRGQPFPHVPDDDSGPAALPQSHTLPSGPHGAVVTDAVAGDVGDLAVLNGGRIGRSHNALLLSRGRCG